MKLSNVLKAKDIYINKWPSDKKDIFIQNLRASKNTIYNKLKKFFSSIPENIKKLLEIINSLSKNLEKNRIGDIASNLLNYGCTIVFILVNCPQIVTYKDICKDFIISLSSNISFKEGIQYIKQNLSNYKGILK